MGVGGIGAGARNELALSLHLQEPLLAEPKPSSQHARRRERVRHREANRSSDVRNHVQVLIAVRVLQEGLLERQTVLAVKEEGLGTRLLLDFADPRGICDMYVLALALVDYALRLLVTSDRKIAHLRRRTHRSSRGPQCWLWHRDR